MDHGIWCQGRALMVKWENALIFQKSFPLLQDIKQVMMKMNASFKIVYFIVWVRGSCVRMGPNDYVEKMFYLFENPFL